MKPKVKFLRTEHRGPMGQDLRNVWTCGSQADGRYHEHRTQAQATACPRRDERRQEAAR